MTAISNPFACLMGLALLLSASSTLAVDEGAPAPGTPSAQAPLPPASHPELRNGSFGIYQEGDREAPQTSARVGLLDGRLHIIAARWEGGIFNPALALRFDLPLDAITGVGMKKYGRSRQLHLDLGDRKLVVGFSGKAFGDAKSNVALYEQLVAAGVPVFEPKRFIGYPRAAPIYISY